LTAYKLQFDIIIIDWRPLNKLPVRKNGPIPHFEFMEEFIIIKVLTKITI